MTDSPAAPWLAANLEALAAALGTPVQAGGDGRWVVTASPDGPMLQLRTATGALVAAHSRRQPAAEAARLVDDALAGRPCPPVALVIGAGLGGTVATLLERDASVRVLVIEPDPSGAAALLGHRDWTGVIASGRLLVLIGPDFRGVEGAWRFVPAGDAAPLVIVHPVLAREYPDDARRAAAVGTRVLGDARANAGAESTLAAPYLLNTIANLGVVAHEGDVDALAGAFDGVPAIVVAAGPSLDRAIGDLVRLQDRALIIAVDTAVGPLLAQGVAPHLAVAVDPSERNARHLSDLDGAGGTWLVAEASVHPTAFLPFAGRTFSFRVGDNHPWPWLASLGVRRGTLAAWGSVLVSALDLAIRVGARPITLVGADLAYTGGQPYCRGTAFEEDWAREVRHGQRLVDIWSRVAQRAGAHQQPDVEGHPAPTLPHLVAFRDRLIEQMRASGRRIVNATGAGILHGPGLEVASLGAVLGDAARTIELRARLAERHAPSPVDGTGLATALARRDVTAALAATTPGVDREHLAARVAIARDAIAAPVLARPAARLGAGREAPIWWPEQTATLASLGETSAAARAPLAMSTVETPLSAVVAAARTLLAHDPLLASHADAKAAAQDFLALPLPLVLPFAPPARADAGRFSAALTRWAHTARNVASLGAPEADFWATAPEPLDDASVATERASDANMLARVTIGATLTSVARRVGGTAPIAARAGMAIMQSWPRTVVDAPRSARVSLDLSGPGGERTPWIGDAALAPLARALTGAVVPIGGRAGSPTRSDRIDLVVSVTIDDGQGWSVIGEAAAEGARLLTPEPCAPCLFGSAFDDGRAIVSRQDFGGSYLVDADGTVSAAQPWPVPILAEAPWGGEGRSYAWTSRPARLLVRDPAGAVSHDVALPFTPTGAAADGESLRFTALDGLWHWTPERGPVRVAETPPLVFAAERDGGLDLAPLPLPVEIPQRRRTRRVLSWSASDGIEVAPAPPLGPCWSRSTRGGWTAEAFPDANLVCVTAGRERRGWVIADYPRTVAWAGGSLVLVLASGRVALVRDVRAALG